MLIFLIPICNGYTKDKIKLKVTFHINSYYISTKIQAHDKALNLYNTYKYLKSIGANSQFEIFKQSFN